MADPMEGANREAIPTANPSADGSSDNLAPTSRASSQPREANESPSRLSGSGDSLGNEAEPEALRPLARALIDLAVSLLAEEEREEREEKAA